MRLSRGSVPWWIFDGNSRVPGASFGDYSALLSLALAGRGRTVAEAIRDRGPLWHGFWEPLTLAVLNTVPERGQARLLWRALAETFVRGGHRSRPVLAPRGWGSALVDPALAWLRDRGVRIAFGATLRAFERAGGRVAALDFAGIGRVTVAAGDHIVLALPPRRLSALMPELDLPEDDAGIVNAHFTVGDSRVLAGKPPITGLLGGRGHWIFLRGDVVSMTISAADRLGEMTVDPDDLLPALWVEAARALDLPSAYVAGRINKERRATFDQSPDGVGKRPGARTSLANLVLAGDATRTGLPATIEGAVRSGETAARLIVGDQR